MINRLQHSRHGETWAALLYPPRGILPAKYKKHRLDKFLSFFIGFSPKARFARPNNHVFSHLPSSRSNQWGIAARSSHGTAWWSRR